MIFNYSEIRQAKIILKIFIFSSIASFLYSLVTNKYGGDYLFQDVTLNFYFLTFNLILNLIPYFILWKFYLKFKKSNNKYSLPISQKFIFTVSLFLFFYTILVVVLFGVGKMEADVYDAPQGIKFIIQIMNRVNFVYMVLFFILISKNLIYDLFGVFMILIVSYFTAGLGSLLYVIFVFIIKYYTTIKQYYKKNKLIIMFFLVFSPYFVNQLFILRDSLRNSETKEITTIDLVFGKLAGRLSSYPNSAVIIQEPLYFFVAAASLDNYYYQIQAWKAFAGGDYRDKKPEFIMKGVYTDGKMGDINSAFMTSTPGNLIISFFRSPLSCFFNILTIFLFFYIIFRLMSFFKFEYAADFAFILIIYPVTSGVSSEYIGVITTLLFLLFINVFYFLLIRTKNINVI